MKENLSLLISRIIPQCADIERKIRKNALTILQAILSKVLRSDFLVNYLFLNNLF